MDQTNNPQAPAAGAQVSDATNTATVAPTPPKPLALRRGDRIKLCYRRGRVDQVRGSWKKPYDVRISWDGEKYPVYVLYSSLELEHARGRLAVG